MKHMLATLWHDCLIHPICGLLWMGRTWLPRLGQAGDRLHCWSVDWPWPHRRTS